MGLEWEGAEPGVVTPRVQYESPILVEPLTQQEWNMLFEHHLTLQINPSDLTRNIAMIHELRQRAWLEVTNAVNETFEGVLPNQESLSTPNVSSVMTGMNSNVRRRRKNP